MMLSRWRAAWNFETRRIPVAAIIEKAAMERGSRASAIKIAIVVNQAGKNFPTLKGTARLPASIRTTTFPLANDATHSPPRRPATNYALSRGASAGSHEACELPTLTTITAGLATTHKRRQPDAFHERRQYAVDITPRSVRGRHPVIRPRMGHWRFPRSESKARCGRIWVASATRPGPPTPFSVPIAMGPAAARMKKIKRAADRHLPCGPNFSPVFKLPN